jgi:hypothetical protein
MSSRSRVGFEDDYYRDQRRDDVEVRFRERSRSRDRLPSFMRDDLRRPEPGPLVLRQREIETAERRRRSPSPVRVRETRIVRARSVSPAPPKRTEEDLRYRTVIREPSRGPDMERLRTRIRDRSSSSSPSPDRARERIRARIVERGRSPSPVHEHIRIVEKSRERRPRSPSPSPPPPPQVIKGPIIEREVITHYRDIDHGMVSVRSPSPLPAPRRREKESDRHTDIDIYTSRRETEVDIHKHSHSHSRGRSPSRERVSRPIHRHDDSLSVHADKRHLHVDIEARRSSSCHRRAHSEAPPHRHYDYDDEAREITSRIDARGRMGEARNGITKDWTIVDVPPGTERVRMDGAGGASAEVTWQKYSGVRRSKFIPDRDESTVVSSSTSLSERQDDRRGSRLSVAIYDKDSREREVEVEKVSDRRVSIRKPSPTPQRSEMWTEITKDLVVREAIEDMGYEYEETEYFYYIMTYLKYEDVLQLVQHSDSIRQSRKSRLHEIQWERSYRDDWDREYRIHSHSHHHHDTGRRRRHDDDRMTEITYEQHRGSRHYH